MDVSDIFFSSAEGKGESKAPGRGRGSPRRREGGGGFFFEWKLPRRGGVSRVGGGGGGEGLGGCLQGIWGGGLNLFFSGPKFPPRLFSGELIFVM